MSGAQFAAVPIRASRDKKLSRGDWAVLSVIAYYARFNKNGQGCTARIQKLADEAGVQPAHWARHTRTLKERGYIEIEQAPQDRRRQHYSIVYDEDAAQDSTEKVTKYGDNLDEIVTKQESQAVDSVQQTSPLRDPAKQRLRYSAKPRGDAMRPLFTPARGQSPPGMQGKRAIRKTGPDDVDIARLVKLLGPIMPRPEAVRFIMEAEIYIKLEVGETAAGRTIGRAVKAWSKQSFANGSWSKLRDWSIRVERREAA